MLLVIVCFGRENCSEFKVKKCAESQKFICADKLNASLVDGICLNSSSNVKLCVQNILSSGWVSIFGYYTCIHIGAFCDQTLALIAQNKTFILKSDQPEKNRARKRPRIKISGLRNPAVIMKFSGPRWMDGQTISGARNRNRLILKVSGPRMSAES